MKSVTFELKLFKHFKAHLIIHMTLLESASENARFTKIMNVKKYKNQDYVVERILKKDQINKTNHYFIK